MTPKTAASTFILLVNGFKSLKWLWLQAKVKKFALLDLLLESPHPKSTKGLLNR